MFGVHISMAHDVWNAVKEYAEAIGESSLSRVARRLLREQLTELGYIKTNTAANSQNAPCAQGDFPEPPKVSQTSVPRDDINNLAEYA